MAFQYRLQARTVRLRTTTVNISLVATALIAPCAILLDGSCRGRLILLGCYLPISASGMKGINSLGRALRLSEGMFWQVCVTRADSGASYRRSRKMKPSRLPWRVLLLTSE